MVAHQSVDSQPVVAHWPDAGGGGGAARSGHSAPVRPARAPGREGNLVTDDDFEGPPAPRPSRAAGQEAMSWPHAADGAGEQGKVFASAKSASPKLGDELF